MFCIVLFFYLPNIVDKMTYSQIVARGIPCVATALE